MEAKKQFVVLEHLDGPDKGFRFYTMNTDKDPTHGNTGELWYKIVGYVDTDEETQDLIHENCSSGASYLHHISQYPPELLEMMGLNPKIMKKFSDLPPEDIEEISQIINDIEKPKHENS